MTFEEFEKWNRRMEERHEALAQSLEILTHDVHQLQGEVADLKTSVADLKAIAEISLQNINALARIAENHERRITGLEGGE